MAGQLKPFTLYMRGIGPNPWKVIFILEELGLPCERSVVEEKDLKIEPYISVNPNGRLPGLIDPNKDITLWEVRCAILYSLSASRLSNAILVRSHR
jgi:glutathione S-transferase